MAEFWEENFQKRKAMWGEAPADSALLTAALFQKRGHKEILVPGIGYGRNARPFMDAGMTVTGIEISETAIAMAEANFGPALRIFHGSASDMPFDDKSYDGIFSFALIHLLGDIERQKFIAACYSQLKPGGSMVFITIADTAPQFGTGKKISERLYETMPGVRLFFYDTISISHEFGRYGLQGFHGISEPAKNMVGVPDLDFLWIECMRPQTPHL